VWIDGALNLHSDVSNQSSVATPAVKFSRHFRSLLIQKNASRPRETGSVAHRDAMTNPSSINTRATALLPVSLFFAIWFVVAAVSTLKAVRLEDRSGQKKKK
jgi:hypothetical protein